MYKPEERCIFTYFDGRTERKADPMAVSRHLIMALRKEGYDLQTVLNIVFPTDADGNQIEAEINSMYTENVEALLGAIRTAFKLPPFEEDGLAEGECLGLLMMFQMYINDIKKKAESLVNGSESTTVTQDPVDSITPNTSDCGSTVSE